MNQPLTWTTIEDIAIALTDKFPDVDPLTVRFTDLLKWVTELEGSATIPKLPMRKNSKPSKWPGTKNGQTGNTQYRVVRRPGHLEFFAPLRSRK